MYTDKRKVLLGTFIILLALLLTTSGYLFAQHKADKEKASLRNQITQLKDVAASLKSKTNAPLPDYFILLQPYGVKFPYSNGFGNIVYTPNNGNIYFDLESSTDGVPLSPGNGTSCYELPGIGIIGALGFLSRTVPSNSYISTRTNVLVAQLGIYNYYYTYPKSCPSLSAPDSTIRDNEIKIFVGDLKNMQLAN
jgi:hypothetical protein